MADGNRSANTPNTWFHTAVSAMYTVDTVRMLAKLAALTEGRNHRDVLEKIVELLDPLHNDLDVMQAEMDAHLMQKMRA